MFTSRFMLFFLYFRYFFVFSTFRDFVHFLDVMFFFVFEFTVVWFIVAKNHGFHTMSLS